MWIIFGLIAMIATCLNLYMYGARKDYKRAMAIGLSFTVLTTVVAYSMVADWVEREDWASLLDVVPTMKTVLWIVTVLSIVLNLLPMLLETKKQN